VNDLGSEVTGTGASTRVADEVVDAIRARGGKAVANHDSVADFATAERIVGTAVKEFGGLDILVNNAGILRDRMIFNMSEEEWDSVIAVHLKGTFNCVRHACTHMRERRYGRIVTFTSGAGLFGNPGQSNYGAAKSGIGGLTKVAARDLGKYGITVNAISPVAGTRMTVTDAYLKARELRKQQGIQREDRGVNQIEELDPDDVAPMVVYLASEYAGGVNGQIFLCFGSQVALVAPPRPVKTLYKTDGDWTLDEIERLAPSTILDGLVNPAPPKEA
jgi:NAD(P)-dependent dehydrogenase (short-subunit alcohol dehydrogenase family)